MTISSFFAGEAHWQNHNWFCSLAANYFYLFTIPIKANIANTMTMVPEIQFTNFRELVLNFDLNKFTPLLRIIHQRAEPNMTPRTIDVAEIKLPFELPNPRPANMAAKDNIVIGLVMVRKNVDT